METAPSRRNDALEKAFSFPSLLVKRRPSKAAVQAFLDRKSNFKPCLAPSTFSATHYLGTESAFLYFAPRGEAPSFGGLRIEESIGAGLAFLFVVSRFGRSTGGEMLERG
jgi:hypothetical protein